MIATLTREGDAVLLRVPYHRDFVQELKATIPPAERRWSKVTRQWTIGAEWEGEVVELLTVYGFDVRRQGDSERAAPLSRGDDAWAALWLRPGAPREVVEAAYRALAPKWHPDRQPEARKAEATRMMAAINRAVEIVRREVT